MASIKKTTAEKRAEKRDILLTRRGGQCTNCGLRHDGMNGYVLDLHHLDHTKKEFSLKIANMDRKMTTLYAEADKCVILCANCHRHEHHHSRSVKGTTQGTALHHKKTK
jgi:hypothetical protein